MKRLYSLLSVLCLLLWAWPVWAATYTQTLTAQFGSALSGQAANVRVTVFDYLGNTQVATTNVLSTGTATATGAGTTTTLVTASLTNLYVGTTLLGATGTAGNIGQTTKIVSMSGNGPYTITVSPALPVATTSADTFTYSNAIMESTDAAGTANTGAYLCRVPVDSAWFPIHVKFTIVGQTGVVAHAILGTDRAAGAADGLTTSTISNINTGAASAGTAATQSTNAATSAANTYTRIGANGAGLTSVGLSATQAFNNTGQTTKQAATLASGDVTGNLPANITQIAGQTANAAAAVTFPNSIGTSTYAGADTAGTTSLVNRLTATRAGLLDNLSNLDALVSSRLATGAYTAPANPTDYARNNVAPTWYAAGGDPFGISKTGGTYGAGTWGNFFAAQLDTNIGSRMATFTLPTRFSSLAIDTSGNMTVGGYATGQDPATLILAASIDGSLTFKQIQAITMAYLAGRYTTVRDTVAKTLTTTYKRADNTTTLAVSVTSYADTGLTQPTGRTWTYFNLP